MRETLCDRCLCKFRNLVLQTGVVGMNAWCLWEAAFVLTAAGTQVVNGADRLKAGRQSLLFFFFPKLYWLPERLWDSVFL